MKPTTYFKYLSLAFIVIYAFFYPIKVDVRFWAGVFIVCCLIEQTIKELKEMGSKLVEKKGKTNG